MENLSKFVWKKNCRPRDFNPQPLAPCVGEEKETSFTPSHPLFGNSWPQVGSRNLVGERVTLWKHIQCSSQIILQRVRDGSSTRVISKSVRAFSQSSVTQKISTSSGANYQEYLPATRTVPSLSDSSNPSGKQIVLTDSSRSSLLASRTMAMSFKYEV